MILSAALDNGYIFIILIAILTSVVSAVYYLVIIKQIFFDQPDYKLNPKLKNDIIKKKINIKPNIVVYSSLISPIIETVVGLTQFIIKILFAFNTISHVGFILFALSI